jgi:abortive infection bacteriophage resistance protein
VKYQKPPETTAQHITKLQSRGLIIDDKPRATELLTYVGYYRLSAYTLPFETVPTPGSSRSHQFIPGTKFQDIVDLYFFDRHLRLLILDAIEKIEVALRAIWADALSLETNDSHAHIKADNFSDPWEHLRQLSFTVGNFSNPRAAVSKEPFISHYTNEYDDPFIPHIWATIETMTFGTLSKWVKATKSNNVKKQLFRSFGLKNIKQIEGVLHTLTPIRNVCAHHNRLWNRLFKLSFQDLHFLQSSMQPKNSTNREDRKLYNTLVVLSHIVSKVAPRSKWQQRLYDLLDSQPSGRLVSMGFPSDWKRRDIWQVVANSQSN